MYLPLSKEAIYMVEILKIVCKGIDVHVMCMCLDLYMYAEMRTINNRNTENCICRYRCAYVVNVFRRICSMQKYVPYALVCVCLCLYIHTYFQFLLVTYWVACCIKDCNDM